MPQQSPQSETVSVETSRLTAHEIFEQASENARDELSRSTRGLAFSGLAGGLTMGLTALAVSTVRAFLPPDPVFNFISYLFYPVGFIAVIIGRAQLFTENTLYPVVLILKERGHVLNTLRLWLTVFVANVAGAFLFAVLATRTSALQPKVSEELVSMGTAMAAASISSIFWSGVIGGWLIALVAWMVSASHWTIGQIVMVWMLTFVVGAGRFAHCIATSGEILSAWVSGPVLLTTYFHWLLFATAGNIMGGVIIVSLLNWGQVHADGGGAQEAQSQAPRRAA